MFLKIYHSNIRLDSTYYIWYPVGILTVVNFLVSFKNYYEYILLKYFFLLLVILFFIAVSLILFKLFEQLKWQKSIAKIKSYTEEKETFLDRWMVYNIFYTYNFLGREYSSINYSLFKNDYKSNSDFYEDRNIDLGHSIVAGEDIVIWVNPKTPSESVIKKGVHSDTQVKIAVLLLLLLVNSYICTYKY